MRDQVRVFVSHHHSPQDDTFTARLAGALEALGADVWVDIEGVASGAFVRRINEGLAERQKSLRSARYRWKRVGVDQ